MATKNRPKVEKSEKNQTTEPQRVMRGTESFLQDRYKLNVAVARHNIAPTRWEPNLVNVEHCHFYRSFDRKGRAGVYSSAQAGHCHKVETFVENGVLKAKCGPPVKMGFQGRNKVYNQVKFWSKKQKLYYEDQHTHLIDYQRSENISKKAIADQQKADGAKLDQLMSAGQPVNLPDGTTFKETDRS